MGQFFVHLAKQYNALTTCNKVRIVDFTCYKIERQQTEINIFQCLLRQCKQNIRALFKLKSLFIIHSKTNIKDVIYTQLFFILSSSISTNWRNLLGTTKISSLERNLPPLEALLRFQPQRWQREHDAQYTGNLEKFSTSVPVFNPMHECPYTKAWNSTYFFQYSWFLIMVST